MTLAQTRRYQRNDPAALAGAPVIPKKRVASLLRPSSPLANGRTP